MTQKFVFFWESDSPFSNWYPQSFIHEEKSYNCSEQYMMYRKALLFNDYDVAEMIMEQTSPRKQKFLGRQVRGFDQEQWMEHCEEIMIPALVSKFTQDSYSLKCLLETGDATIVEASPYDKIWGIGMDKDDPRAIYTDQWDGLNLLGKVLMKTREIIVAG
jgi:ribA/ribD-fused uncharacterized protein